MKRVLMRAWCLLFNRDQAYFWTKEWQASERRADEDFAAGRYKTFDSYDSLEKDLLS